MKKENSKKTIMTIFVKDGNIYGGNDFEDSIKWDSPGVVKAVRKKLNNKRGKK